MSVELVLIRHAIAFERNAQRWPDDRARPLTSAGKERFRKAAIGLAEWLPEVDRVLTSPLVRARETAHILAEHASWPIPVDCQQLAPPGDPEALFAVLRKQRGKRFALVGHEPDLSAFTAACLPGSVSASSFEVKKGGVVCVNFGSRPSAGTGVLAAFVPPRVLRGLR